MLKSRMLSYNWLFSLFECCSSSSLELCKLAIVDVSTLSRTKYSKLPEMYNGIVRPPWEIYENIGHTTLFTKLTNVNSALIWNYLFIKLIFI